MQQINNQVSEWVQFYIVSDTSSGMLFCLYIIPGQGGRVTAPIRSRYSKGVVGLL